MSHESWQDRTALLWGGEAVENLSRARVLVVGVGGVGGFAVEMLARAGIGMLGLADGDRVEPTNRNRQMAALVSTEGEFKTDVLAARAREIHPDLRIRTFTRYFRPETMSLLFDGYRWDCVLDAIDTVVPKTALLLECVRRGIPAVSCMGAGARQDPGSVKCADLSRTTVCPLAKIIRTNLRKQGVASGITAVFSDESPIPGSIRHDTSSPDKRSVTGTVSYMPAVFGCHCAAAVLRILRAEKR